MNGLMTFPFIIVLLFCIGDVTSVLQSSIGLISPFTQIVYNSTGSVGASIVLAAISTVVAFAAGLDLYGAAARMLWSLARENALPEIFSRIHPTLDVPVYALLVLFFPALLIPMIYIWNSTAFYGIMAGVLVFFQLTYIIPISMNLFYGRWYGGHTRGPWSMGRYGFIVDVCSCAWLIFTILFMSFPVYEPVTAENM